MPGRLFYKSQDRLYLSSYRKANIRALAKHCIKDIQELNNYIHKIIQLRFLIIKYVFLRMFASNGNHVFSKYISEYNGLFLLHFFKYTEVSARVSYFSTFYSMNASYLDQFATLFYDMYSLFICYYLMRVELFKFAIFYKNGICSLPTRISRFTVLRSPHTDKKSREQFERRTHRKVYMFPAVLSNYYSFLCTKHYIFFLCAMVHEIHIPCHE